MNSVLAKLRVFLPGAKIVPSSSVREAADRIRASAAALDENSRRATAQAASTCREARSMRERLKLP